MIRYISKGKDLIYTLQKADSKEFAQWWAVYRPNEDFSQNHAEQYSDIVDVPFCYWILADDTRIGGMICVKNRVGDLFIIPPFDDVNGALKAILPDGRMMASSILTEHISAFESLGFTLMESRQWMMRSTQAYDDVSFDFRRESPQPDQIHMIAESMHIAFRGGVGEYGERDVIGFTHSVNNFFDTIELGDKCHQASSVLWDADKMIAVCLLQPYKSHVAVRFVVTHPDYRGQGIARRLMEYGMNCVREDYPTVVLAVTEGNPAQHLYEKMGLTSAPATHTLIRNPE